jgi:hypothetical protein
MTSTEAEELLMKANGRLCVRFYRRTDGRVMTQDCPIGLAALKRRVIRAASAVAGLLFAGSLLPSRRVVVSAETEPLTPAPATTINPPQYIMGDVAVGPFDRQTEPEAAGKALLSAIEKGE